MPMRLDGVDVLRRIIDRSDVFPMPSDLDTLARKIVVARMKALTSVSEVRMVYSILGEENFKMLADGITDAEAKTILTKVDKENKEAKTAGGPAQRVLLVELATGRTEPLAKAIKEKPPAKGGARSSAGKAARAQAPGATRKRPPS